MKRSDMGLPVQELVLLLVVFLVAALLFHKFINYRNRLIFGVVTFLALLLTGFLWHNTYNKYQLHRHFSTYYVPENTVSARFEEFPEENARSYKSILRVLQLTDSSGKAAEVKGKVIAYFAKSGHPEDVAYGDKVVFTGTIGEGWREQKILQPSITVNIWHRVIFFIRSISPGITTGLLRMM
ncbi:MAG: DUF4131 domain-containing protein [Bacteroidales bacterium]|nr:DUF4131 domain-containing protein [Bacteroidales bacterium]